MREAGGTKRGNAEQRGDKAAVDFDDHDREYILRAVEEILQADKILDQESAEQSLERRTGGDDRAGDKSLNSKRIRDAVEEPAVRDERAEPDSQPHSLTQDQDDRERNPRGGPNDG